MKKSGLDLSGLTYQVEQLDPHPLAGLLWEVAQLIVDGKANYVSGGISIDYGMSGEVRITSDLTISNVSSDTLGSKVYG